MVLDVNKIKGMLLSGAYGDALGISHEETGLSKQIFGNPNAVLQLPQGKDIEFFHRDYGFNKPWGIWAKRSQVKHLRGIPSDDSSYRIAILEPWLLEIAHAKSKFTEKDFLLWMQTKKPSTLWWHAKREEQINTWLQMFAKAPYESYAFFVPKVPIFFGMFLYLEAAIAFAHKPAQEIYQRFSSMCKLDQSYAGKFTGLGAALLAKSHQENPSTDYYQWATEKISKWLRDWSAPLQKQLQEIAISLNREIAALGELENISEIEFLKRYQKNFTKFIFKATKRQSNIEKWMVNFDPLLNFSLILAALKFAKGDVAKAFRVVAVAPGDADTTASFMGLLIGAYYGQKVLIKDLHLKKELENVEKCLSELFDYNLQSQAKLFQKLSEKID